VNNFKKLNEAVRRNFAEILLATMTCLSKLYSNLKSELHIDPSREQVTLNRFDHSLRIIANTFDYDKRIIALLFDVCCV
jgi:regulator of PEP synthase PpsR (kinase-PPPase family)